MRPWLASQGWSGLSFALLSLVYFGAALAEDIIVSYASLGAAGTKAATILTGSPRIAAAMPLPMTAS